MSEAWRFYDFQANWDEFYNVWMSDPVQVVLEPHMQEWCTHEAYYDHTSCGLVKPTWHRCRDLWTYSRTDYHCQKIIDRVNEYVDKNECFSRYLQAQRRFGIELQQDDNGYQAFWNTCNEHIHALCEPAPGSLEANFLCGGANYLAPALKAAAQVMFPDCDVEIRKRL